VTPVRRLLNDPLLHFLAAGLFLFVVGNAVKPPPAADKTIVVDRSALLQFIQYRSKAFEPRAAAALLDGLDDEARGRLIEDFVREEALAREAKALSLDANDYVIRQRMVQKVEFLAEAAAAPADPTEADLAAYYDANKDRYASPPSATLTHIFFSTEKKPAAAAEAEAVKLLSRLNAAKAGFNDATQYGDRFLFHKNYVDRTDDYIRSQLGDAVNSAVFNPATPLDRWTGPYLSQYGAHLIYVASRSPARLAPLSEIENLVRSDLVEERRQQAIDRAIGDIVKNYTVDDRISRSE
jgi:parvulin-like peptidyl-prolyl isomerase